MNYSEIEAFLAVVQSGSLTNAAKNLFITQPTLSNRIRSLETELGTTFILRGKGIRNIELTPAGKDFVHIAEKWQGLWVETKNIGNQTGIKNINIGATHSINTYLMPDIYQKFTTDSEGLSVSLLTLHSYEAYHHVENNEVEIALVTNSMYAKRVKTTPIFSEKMCFICGSDSKYKSVIHPSTLNVRDEIMLYWCREFLQWHEYWFGANGKPIVYTDDMQIMENFVGKNDMWLIAPVSVANALMKKKDLRICTLEEGPDQRITYLLTHSTANLSLEIQNLMIELEKVLSKTDDIKMYEGAISYSNDNRLKFTKE